MDKVSVVKCFSTMIINIVVVYFHCSWWFFCFIWRFRIHVCTVIFFDKFYAVFGTTTSLVLRGSKGIDINLDCGANLVQAFQGQLAWKKDGQAVVVNFQKVGPYANEPRYIPTFQIFPVQGGRFFNLRLNLSIEGESGRLFNEVYLLLLLPFCLSS